MPTNHGQMELDIKTLKIMIIEDEKHHFELMERAIKKELPNAVVDLCEKADFGLDRLEETSPDIIIADYLFSGMSGLELFEELKMRKIDIPVIVVTGHGDESVAVRAMKLGAFDYVVKSGNFFELIPESIRKALYTNELKSRARQAEEELRRNQKTLEKAFKGAIHAISRIIEHRDPYTAHHQVNVARMCKAIARRLGMKEERIEALFVAAAMHDIGKIGVPAEILSKPTSLTPAEMGLIRQHPQTTYDILSAIDWPWPIAEIAIEHHERLDGSGYPKGLKGDEMSLEGRIMAVADVMDAMIHHRPYRPARGLKEAIEELKGGRGALYDPQVVDACVKILKSGKWPEGDE